MCHVLLILVVHEEQCAAHKEYRTTKGSEAARETLLRAQKISRNLRQEWSAVVAHIDEHGANMIVCLHCEVVETESGHYSKSKETIEEVSSKEVGVKLSITS